MPGSSANIFTMEPYSVQQNSPIMCQVLCAGYQGMRLNRPGSCPQEAHSPVDKKIQYSDI